MKTYQKLDGEIEMDSLNVYVCKNNSESRRDWESLNVWLNKEGIPVIVEIPGGFHGGTKSLSPSEIILSDDKLSVKL